MRVQSGFCCALCVAFAASVASTVSATPLVVDGGTADWGPIVADNNASIFAFLGGIGLVGSMVEDSDDLADDGGIVGPNQGGQNYDAEAMAIAVQGGTLYGLIVSGQRPDNGIDRFGPGDILIQTTGNSYAIEVGGGAGGGAFANSVNEGSGGSKYSLFGNGFTDQHAAVGAAQVAGSIWKNPGLLLDPIPPEGPTQIDPSGPGTLIGTADYVFTRDAFTAQHSVIEFSLPLSLFNGENIVSAAWRPACGNDELMVVPEPSTVAILALLGLVSARRKRA